MKDIMEIMVRDIIRVISVAISTAMSHAVNPMIQTVKETVAGHSQSPRQVLLLKYENDKL